MGRCHIALLIIRRRILGVLFAGFGHSPHRGGLLGGQLLHAPQAPRLPRPLSYGRYLRPRGGAGSVSRTG